MTESDCAEALAVKTLFVWRLRNDDYVRPNDGLIPHVACMGSALSNYFPCTSYGAISPDIKVQYDFYQQHISQWAAIDAEVFKFIASIRQEEN